MDDVKVKITLPDGRVHKYILFNATVEEKIFYERAGGRPVEDDRGKFIPQAASLALHGFLELKE